MKILTSKCPSYPPDFPPNKQKLPLWVHGRWTRFKERIDYSKANCSLIVGIQDSGKSALNEALCTNYMEASGKGSIIDLFGSRDNEGLAWLRSPYDKILLVCGNNTDLACSWDVKHLKDLRLSDLDKYQVVISVSRFYSKLREEHLAIRDLMDLLWERTHWTYPHIICIREAANLIYSRISVGEDQKRAKAYFLYVLREARHMGYAAVVDAIRYLAVDIDLRSISHYTYFKACGKDGLPKSVRFLYGYFNEYSIMRMPARRYALLRNRVAIGRGAFELGLWHKIEREDMLKTFDIQPDHGEPIERSTSTKVGDFEHETIIIDRLGGMAYEPLAKKYKHSSKTVYNQVQRHNDKVTNEGVCPKCERVRSRLKAKVIP